jgi:hypothetical protein
MRPPASAPARHRLRNRVNRFASMVPPAAVVRALDSETPLHARALRAKRRQAPREGRPQLGSQRVDEIRPLCSGNATYLTATNRLRVAPPGFCSVDELDCEFGELGCRGGRGDGQGSALCQVPALVPLLRCELVTVSPPALPGRGEKPQFSGLPRLRCCVWPGVALVLVVGYAPDIGNYVVMPRPCRHRGRNAQIRVLFGSVIDPYFKGAEAGCEPAGAHAHGSRSSRVELLPGLFRPGCGGPGRRWLRNECSQQRDHADAFSPPARSGRRGSALPTCAPVQ